MNKFVYELDGNLYVNLTNKCSNACEFCVRSGKDTYFGNPLWLEREPVAEEVIALLGNVNDYKELVFCGFGEPTYKVDEIEKIGIYAKSRNVKVRLNTNGQGNLINGYDITARLKESVDTVSISLNESSAEKYQGICHSVYGQAAFSELISFAVLCKAKGIDTLFSVVDSIGAEEIEKCRKIAEDNGIRLKVRALIENS